MENSEEIRQCGNEWRYCDGDCANCPAGKTFTTDRTVVHGMSAGEALARLKRMYDPLVYGVPMDPRGEEAQNFNAIITAISALEKQIGKKPVRVNKNGDLDGNFEVVCPVCGIKLMERITTNEMSYPRIYNGTGYCCCGQKIDWPGEKGDRE